MRFFLSFILILLYSFQVHGEDAIDLQRNILVPLEKKVAMEKDNFLQGKINSIVSATATVKGVSPVKTFDYYKKKYVIGLSLSFKSKKYICNVYTDYNYMDILKKGDSFQFSGQFVMYTPLNSLKNKYIFDFILKDGALVID